MAIAVGFSMISMWKSFGGWVFSAIHTQLYILEGPRPKQVVFRNRCFLSKRTV